MKKLLAKFFIVCLIALSSSFIFMACQEEPSTNNTPTIEDNGSNNSPTIPEKTTYKITYMLNGGTNHIDNPSEYKENTSTITLKAPTRTGYEFVGWYTDGLHGIIEENEVKTITSETNKDIILNAKWRGLWYFNENSQTTLTEYAKTLDNIDIIPEITDSFDTYSSKSFSLDFNSYCSFEYTNITVHEGIESFDLASAIRCSRLHLPLSLKTLGKIHQAQEINVPSLETWMSIDIGSNKPLDNKKLFVNNEWLDTLQIPDNTTTVDYGNKFCGGVFNKLIIPNSVTTILGESLNIRVLEEIHIGNNLTNGFYIQSDYNENYYYPDLYMNNKESLDNLLTYTSRPQDTNLFKGKLFIDNKQITNIEIGAKGGFQFKDINNITIKDGVTEIPFIIPSFSGYIIIPASVITDPIKYPGSSFYETYSEKLLLKGTKEDFSSNPTRYLKELGYYYSEEKPTSNMGKFWSYEEDGITPKIWPTSYTTLTKGEYNIKLYNGNTTLYIEFDDSYTYLRGTINIYVLNNNSDLVLIASYTKETSTSGIHHIELNKNVTGFTNSNGEWIYGAIDGNNIQFTTMFAN